MEFDDVKNVPKLGVELTFPKWLAKVSEKMTFFLLNVKEKKEIREEDYEPIKVLHKIWFYGEFPLYNYEYLFLKKEKLAVDQGLFDDRKADSKDGTEVAQSSAETIKTTKQTTETSELGR